MQILASFHLCSKTDWKKITKCRVAWSFNTIHTFILDTLNQFYQVWGEFWPRELVQTRSKLVSDSPLSTKHRTCHVLLVKQWASHFEQQRRNSNSAKRFISKSYIEMYLKTEIPYDEPRFEFVFPEASGFLLISLWRSRWRFRGKTNRYPQNSHEHSFREVVAI